VMLVLVAGIFVWGRLANDDRGAMLLTAAWFAAVLIGAAVQARRLASADPARSGELADSITPLPSASILSASRNLRTTCSGVCLVRFSVIVLARPS